MSRAWLSLRKYSIFTTNICRKSKRGPGVVQVSYRRKNSLYKSMIYMSLTRIVGVRIPIPLPHKKAFTMQIVEAFLYYLAYLFIGLKMLKLGVVLSYKRRTNESYTPLLIAFCITLRSSCTYNLTVISMLECPINLEIVTMSTPRE